MMIMTTPPPPPTTTTTTTTTVRCKPIIRKRCANWIAVVVVVVLF